MTRPRLTALRGLPASGKSTKAKLMSDAGNKAVVVSRDAIRFALFDRYVLTTNAGKIDNAKEDVVTVAQDAQIKALLAAGQNVIVDDCNLRVQYLDRFKNMAYKAGADFEVIDVPTDVDECVRRDIKRGAAGGRRVGEDVIRRMNKRAQWKQVKPRVPMEIEHAPEWDPLLPDAVIFDIDGTLTEGPHERSPFDYTKVLQDILCDDVAWMADVVNAAFRDVPDEKARPRVIIMSGRDGTEQCRADTVEWLFQNGVRYDELHMRPAEMVDGHGNKVSDVVVKYHLFNEHVRGKYNVRFVFDDRRQVVELWRALGLTCGQVRDGDF